MTKFYVKKHLDCFVSIIIDAENEEMAKEIAENFDLDDGFLEDSCAEIYEFLPISDDEEFDIPVLKQTPEGYKVLHA